MLRHREPENGFTLIEVLVVVLIIGVLAAIAVPAFLNQRKEADQAAVHTDLHNASISMETELVKNNNKYPSYLPNYNPRSDGVVVTMVKANSNTQQYCLKGYNAGDPSRVSYYDSANGGLLSDGESCGEVSEGTSFAESANDKTALVIEAAGRHTEQMRALNAYGFKEVVYNTSATVEDMKNYDVIVAFADVWPMTGSKEGLLRQAYENGATIMTDGNDTNHTHRSWAFSSAVHGNYEGARPLYFNQTGNGSLSPSFPYTFQATAFAGDSSWYCITGVKPGTVIVADSPMTNNPSVKCATATASTNSAGGRWVHMSRAPLGTNVESTMLGAALNWLTL